MNASLLLDNAVLSMKFGAGYDVSIYHKIESTGPFAEILKGTLTTLDDTIVPSDVIYLRNYIFQENTGLTSVSLSHVETAGVSVFMGCALENVDMPALKVGGSQMFSYNPLTSICLPKLTEISQQMFQNCENLATAEFEKVRSIYRRAFYNCASLEKLILRFGFPVALEGQNIFYNTKIESGDGYIYVPPELVSSYQTAEGWSEYASQIRSIEELDE